MALAVPFSLWGMIMEKEERRQRMNELLDKENFDHMDYLELKSLIKEDEKEYYDMKDKFMQVAYGMN